MTTYDNNNQSMFAWQLENIQHKFMLQTKCPWSFGPCNPLGIARRSELPCRSVQRRLYIPTGQCYPSVYLQRIKLRNVTQEWYTTTVKKHIPIQLLPASFFKIHKRPLPHQSSFLNSFCLDFPKSHCCRPGQYCHWTGCRHDYSSGPLAAADWAWRHPSSRPAPWTRWALSVLFFLFSENYGTNKQIAKHGDLIKFDKAPGGLNIFLLQAQTGTWSPYSPRREKTLSKPRNLGNWPKTKNAYVTVMLSQWRTPTKCLASPFKSNSAMWKIWTGITFPSPSRIPTCITWPSRQENHRLWSIFMSGVIVDCFKMF